MAASTVPAQGRKSFAVISFPVIALRYSFTSLDVTSWQLLYISRLSERTNYPRDVSEMALAHAIGDRVEAAYRRGDLFEKRRRLMADWATFCGRTQPRGGVVSLRGV
jgi:hypothetical protein